MRQKAANQMTKKNFILYKGHTGWKIKTRLFGTLLVSLSAVAIAESTGTVDVHAATETPSEEVSSSAAPKASDSAVIGTPSSAAPAPSSAAPKPSSAAPAPSSAAPKPSEAAPATSGASSAASGASSAAPAVEKITSEASSSALQASSAAKTPVAKTPVAESTTVASDTTAQYPVLTPGQQVDVSKVNGADGTVKLTADQIKDHFVGTLKNNPGDGGSSKNPNNLSNIPISDTGTVELTDTNSHTVYSTSGITSTVTGHQVAHVSFEHDIDFSHDFSMTGALGIGNNAKDGADSVGIVFAPGDPANAVKGDAGRGLGIESLKNAFGFVYDNFHNDIDTEGGYDIADPGTADYFGWRTTDSKYGSLQADTGADMTVAASSLTLNDRTKNPFNDFVMTYDAGSKQLKVSLGGHDFIRTISDADAASGYSISIAASTGAKTNNYAARIDSFNYTPKTAQVDVSFKAPTTTPLETETAATATPAHVTANVGDTVLVFSSVAAAQRAIAADPTINPNLVTVVPTDADGNVYVVDGSQASTKYISDDATASDGAYYSYVVTGATTQSASVPVSLTFKATITPIDKATGKAIQGIDPIEVNAVAGKSTVVEIPGFTPATITIPVPTNGQTINYNLMVDMSKTAPAGTTVTGDNPVVNPIAHYYTASGTTIDKKPVNAAVTVGTNQSVTDVLNGQIADGAMAGVTSADYYWSTVSNAAGTDSTDASAPQASTSILVPTKAKLDKLIQQATDNQAKADTEKAAAQDIYDKFIAMTGITQDQKDAAKALLDSVTDLYNQISDANATAKSAFEAAEASDVPATIVLDSQNGYNAISSMDDSLNTFQTDLDNLTNASQDSLASFVLPSEGQTYGTPIAFPDVTFGSGFGATVTEAQKQAFNNPDYFYYVNALDSTDHVTPKDAGTYYFKLTDAGRTYLKSLTTNTNAGFYVSAALKINPVAATPTINDTDLVYGGVDGKLAGITASLGSTLADTDHPATQDEFEIVDAKGTVVPVDQLQVGGDYTIKYTDAAQTALKADDNYTFGDFGTAKLNVTPKTITVTANGAQKVYGTNDPTFVLADDSEAGLVNGDQLSMLGVTLTRDTTEENVGTYTGAITGSASGSNKNYTVTVTPGDFAITPAKVTPTIDSTSVVYGGIDGKLPVFTGSLGSDKVNADHPITQDEFEVVDGDGNVVPVNQLQVGGNYTIRYTAKAQAALTADKNYTFGTFGTAVLTVTPKGITVTAQSTSKTYGTADPELVLTDDSQAGLVNGDKLSGLNVTLTRDTSKQDVGTYTGAITGSASGSNKNYTVTVTPGDFAITPAKVTPTIDSTSVVYGGIDGKLPEFTGSLGSDKVNADHPITRDEFEVVDTDGNVVPVSQLQVGGDYKIRYTASAQTALTADKNYTFGTFGTAVLDVTPKKITVKANDAQKVYGTTDPTFVLTDDSQAGLVNGDKLSDLKVTLTRDISKQDVGTYADSIKGSSSSKNYSVTVTPGNFTVTSASPKLTVADAQMIYDDELPTFSATVNVPNNTIAQTDFEIIDKNAAGKPVTAADLQAGGNYTIQLTQDAKTRLANDNPNYDFTKAFGTGTLTVAQRQVTVTVASKTMNAGESIPTNQSKVVVDGSPVHDQPQLDLSYDEPDGKEVGTYTIDAKSANSNYALTVVPGQLKVLGNVVGSDGSTTITEKDSVGNVVKIDKKWADGSQTTYTYDPATDKKTVTEQKNGEQVGAQQDITDLTPGSKVTLSDGEGTNTATVVALDPTTNQPIFEHDTTQTAADGTITTKDTNGSVVKVVKPWADGSQTTYTYDPISGDRTVTDQKDSQIIKQQTIASDGDGKATLVDGNGVETIVDAGQPGSLPTFEHNTTQTATDKDGNVTVTTKDNAGNVINVTKNWADGSQTDYTYNPADGKQTVTEQKDGKTVDSKSLTKDSTEATLTSSKGVETTVDVLTPGAEPTFKHDTTKTDGDTTTTKDANGNVVKVVKQWPDSSQTTYTYDPSTGDQSVTEQKDGKKDTQPIGPDGKATLAPSDDAKTIVNAGQPGAQPTFEHDTTKTVTDAAGNVTATTKDDAGNVIKVTKNWADGSQTDYTYDPVDGKQTVTEQKDGQQVDSKTIAEGSTEATLTSGKGVETTVDVVKPGAEPTFKHDTTQTAGDTTTTMDANGNVIKVVKQWPDSSQTTYTYDPATGDRNVTEQKDGKTVDTQSIASDGTKATLKTGDDVQTVVNAGQPGSQPTFEHDTTITTKDDAGNVTATTKDNAGNAIKVVKQWTDGSQTAYTYDPVEKTQTVTEQKDGKTVAQKTFDNGSTSETLTNGGGVEPLVETFVAVLTPGSVPTFAHNTTQTATDKAGNVTATTKDAAGNAINVTKQWTDGSKTAYVYDPTTGKGTVTEQKDGKTLDQKTIDAATPKATLSAGEGIDTLVDAGQPGSEPTFAHNTTQTTTDKAGNVTTMTKDAVGNVINVTKQWTDGGKTAYTYDPTTGNRTVTEEKDGKTVDQKTISPDETQATLSAGEGIDTLVDAGQPGSEPTFEHDTTQTTKDDAGNVTATTKDADGNVVKVTKQWTDGSQTDYTYDPTTGKQTVTEQKAGQTIDQKTITADAPKATLKSGDGVETIVNSETPGAAPTFTHDTTQTATDKFGNVTDTTKDADGNVVKVTKHWTDGSETAYTYDPATGKQSVTEQKDGKTVDQKTIAADGKATLKSGDGVETIVTTEKPGATPTFAHETTQTATDKSGNVTDTTTDADGNVVKVTKHWADGSETDYAYDPTTGNRTVTEQKAGKTVDQKTIAPDSSTATLTSGEGIATIVNAGQPGSQPTFEHDTTQTTKDAAGNVTATTKDTDGDIVKVAKQWTDGSETIYAYDPTTGQRTVTEQRDGKTVDQQTIVPGASSVTLSDGAGGTATVKFAQSADAMPTFTQAPASHSAGVSVPTNTDADKKPVKVTKQWPDGIQVIYTYDPMSGQRTVQELKKGKLVAQRTMASGDLDAILPDGMGGTTTVKFDESGTEPIFTRQLADKINSRKATSRKKPSKKSLKNAGATRKNLKQAGASKALLNATGHRSVQAVNEGHAGDTAVTGRHQSQQTTTKQQVNQQETELPQTGQKNESFLAQLGAILLALLITPFVRRRSH